MITKLQNKAHMKIKWFTVFDDYWRIIYFSSPSKYTLWVLIRQKKIYVWFRLPDPKHFIASCKQTVVKYALILSSNAHVVCFSDVVLEVGGWVSGMWDWDEIINLFCGLMQVCLSSKWLLYIQLGWLARSDAPPPGTNYAGDINPYKPSVPFLGHRQTVQTKIRCHRTQRLIRVFTVC